MTCFNITGYSLIFHSYQRRDSLISMSLSDKHILVIAGPSACGKSTLIEEMLNDRHVANKILSNLDLDCSLSLGKLNLQRLVDSKKLSKRSRKNQAEIALVQFDILSQHRKARALEFEEVVRSAKSVRLLILYTPFQEWLKRMNRRSNYISGARLSPLSACKGFLGTGSKGFRPSYKAWSIVMASRFSKELGKKMYKDEYFRWDNYWIQCSDVSRFYFDSYLWDFFATLPCLDQ